MGKPAEQQEAWRAAAGRFLTRRLPGTEAWELKAPERGTTSTLFLCRRGGESRYHCVARVFGESKSWSRYIEKLRAMERHGLPAPRLLAASRRWEPFLRREPWMFAESFLDGPLLCDARLSNELARDFGESLGRMHAVTGEGYGWGRRLAPAAQFHERCTDLLGRRVKELRADLARHGRAFPDGLEASVERLDRRLRAWRFAGPFCLVHGELGADDMIWLREEQAVAFIDLAAMRFNHRHFDLLVARQWLCDVGDDGIDSDSIALLESFDNAYWAAAGAEYRAAAQAEEPLIGGLLDVMRMQTRARQIKRQPERALELFAAIERLATRLASRPLA